jgi:hypothetical protein
LDAVDARLLAHGAGRVVALRHAQLSVLLEDEQLIRAGERMLPSDVDDDHG